MTDMMRVDVQNSLVMVIMIIMMITIKIMIIIIIIIIMIMGTFIKSLNNDDRYGSGILLYVLLLS